MADDIASLGLSVDSKPVVQASEQLDKLTAASQKAEKATQQFSQTTGKASAATKQLAAAVEKAQTEAEVMNKVNSAEQIGELGTAARLSGNQIAELGHIARSTFGVLLAGGSIFQALGYEANRLVSVLTIGPNGVGGTLRAIGDLVKSLGGWIVGLITPIAAVAAAAATFAAIAAAATLSWTSAQHDISMALIGVGAAAGVTADDINRISIESAATGKATVGDAREIAIALAQTGKISAQVMEQVVGLGRAYGDLFGTNTADTAEALARAFADPAKGVDDLNKRIGAFDDATRENIKSLALQNNLFEAQTKLAQGITPALAAAAAETSSWSRFWRDIADTSSEYFNNLGKGIADAAGYATTQEKLLKAQAELDRKLSAAKTGHNIFGAIADALNQPGIDKAIENVHKLAVEMQNLQNVQAGQNARNESLRIGDLARSIDPFMADLKRAKDTLADLQDAASKPDVVAGLADTANLTRSIQLLQTYIKYRQDALQVAREDYQVAVLSINARSNEQKGEAAFQAALVNARRSGSNTEREAVTEAELTRKRTLLQLTHDQAEAERERRYQAGQNIESAQLELSLVGQNIGAQTALRTEFQLLAAAKAEAFRNGTTVSDDEAKAAHAEAMAMGNLADQLARVNTARTSAFDKDQLGRTDIDQAVYSKMQAAGLLVNGQIVGAANEGIAAQIRLNEELQRSIEIEKGFASDFLHDMLQGKSATEALANALDNLASKILDNSLSTLFAGLSGLGAVPSKGIFGGNILPGILHSGGEVGSSSYPKRSVSSLAFAGAPRFHDGAALGLKSDEVPAILQKGEVVLPKGASIGSGVTVQINNTFDARGAYPESIADLQKQINKSTASMKQTAIEAFREAKSRQLV